MRHAFDIIIVGSGMAGVATAWYLRAIGHKGSIALIERDPSFAHTATAIPGAVIRQQFTLPENIAMALHGVRFVKEFGPHHGDGASPDALDTNLDFQEHGLLRLADAAQLDQLSDQTTYQQSQKADVALLSPDILARYFPWANFDGIAGGALGLSNEGWFDVDVLHSALRLAVRDWDVTLVKAAVTEIDYQPTQIEGVALDNGKRLTCGHLVNATGVNAGVFARMARVRLPVTPKSQTLFVVHGGNCPAEMPVLVDTSGVFLRPEAGLHLCGKAACEPEDASISDMSPESLFEELIKPTLSQRVPGFEKAKMVRAWEGQIDQNNFDRAPIIGAHPTLSNFYFINGFGGYGIQQAPAAGRAIAELIYHGAYQTIDLTRLGYERLLDKQPLQEVSLL